MNSILTVKKKNMRKSAITATIAILGIGMVMNVITCGTSEIKKSEKLDAVVVIFSSSGAQFERNAIKKPIKTGMLLQKGDKIKTENGSVDLQTRSGHILRIRKFTSLALTEILGEGGSEQNQFTLQNGSVLARVKKSSRREEFTIATPTSIASVRGTVFAVSVEDGKKPQVYVYKGSVAMKPRSPALEKYSKSEIEKNPSLKKMKDSLDKKEVVLHEKMEGSLTPEMEKKVAALNARLNKIRETSKEIKQADQALKIMQQKIDKMKGIKTKTRVTSPQEEAEMETLVSIDEKLIIEAASMSELLSGTKLVALKKEYDNKMNEAMNNIEKKITGKKFKSNKEIKKYYKLLEVVTMLNGTKNSGAVVAQAGNVLILHTTKGAIRMNKNKVDYIDYIHTD